MSVTRSKARQSVQHPSSSSAIFDNENAVVPARDVGSKRINELCFEGNDNPLLNNLVLTTLFDYVEGKELKECRLVCKQWSTLTLPLFRSRFKVTIFGSTSLTSLGQTRKIDNFMNLIGSNTLGIPFGRFCLGAFDTTKSKGHGQRFLQTCGDSAKEIVVHCSANQTFENIGEILKSTSKLESLTIPKNVRSKDGKIVRLLPSSSETKIPKLSSVKILDIGRDWRRGENNCPTFYEELFVAAENISTLEFDGGTDNVGLEVLEMIEKLGRESSIRKLGICSVNQGHLNILRRMAQKPKGLQLKELDLSPGLTDHFEGFELIEIFKNSLIALRVNSKLGSVPNSKVITFPHMPKLKSLHFETHEVSLSCVNFDNVFPSLEKLYLDFFIRFHPNNFILNGNESCPMYKLSAIRCVPIRMENLNRILTIFPTLKIFVCEITLVDGVEIIKKIWTHMAGLEDLSICGTSRISENMDSLVTGIAVTQFKKMKEFFKSLQHGVISDRALKIQNKLTSLTKDRNFDLPSIRNLTNLKSLTLKLGRRAGRTNRDKYLTDISAYFGLYFLNNLRNLRLSDCEMSKSSCEVLVRDKHLVNWKFITPSEHEIIPTLSNQKCPFDYVDEY